MVSRRLAMWIAGAVLVLAGASTAPGLGSTASTAVASGSARVETARADQQTAVAVRPLGERASFDVRTPLRPLPLGWTAAEVAVAVVVGLVTRVRSRSVVVAADDRRALRFDRGPPAAVAP